MASAPRKIFFDIETRNIFSDVGSNDPKDLDISVVCIYDSKTEEFSSYLLEDLGKLWPIIEQADMLIGYNSDHFDIPLLDKYYPGDLTKIKSIDLMKEVRNVLGRRLKLDTIAEATLGRNKSGHGLEAITWWKNGEIDKIIKYCIEDVRITKEIYDYARANKKLLYKDMGQLKEVKLDPRGWEKKIDTALTHTLPF